MAEKWLKGCRWRICNGMHTSGECLSTANSQSSPWRLCTCTLLGSVIILQTVEVPWRLRTCTLLGSVIILQTVEVPWRLRTCTLLGSVIILQTVKVPWRLCTRTLLGSILLLQTVETTNTEVRSPTWWVPFLENVFNPAEEISFPGIFCDSNLVEARFDCLQLY